MVLLSNILRNVIIWQELINEGNILATYILYG